MVDISNIGSIGSSGMKVPVKSDVPLPSLQRAPVQVSLPIDVPPAVDIPTTQEQARFAEVKAASQAVARNPYPISDQRFTIFKDIAGDYVTRFTSLVDGSVKYFPEKTLFEYVQILQSKASGASLNTEA